jgi:hypothetical protein
MTPSSCPRLFEVEAMRDGRLAGAELTSFERHLVSCTACSREAQVLEGLARRLRASRKDGTDELRVRRERTRLLSAFNQSLVAPEGRWKARRSLLAPAALALLALALFVVWRVRAPEPPAAVTAVPGIVVRADSAAVWSERSEGGRKMLVIERGALWIHVDPASETGRLLVVLPDGELEDKGTTFSVSVEDGRTARVAVEEGSVILRLRGQAPVTIGPGNAWTPGVRPARAPPSAAPAAELAPPDPAPAEPARAALPPTQARMPSPPPAGSTPSASLARDATWDASSDFRAALAALHGGSSRDAAAKFTDFLQQYPRDARAEDAAYLRIIALQRSGDAAAMKEAALAYLRRYPTGFRRAEAEKLAR